MARSRLEGERLDENSTKTAVIYAATQTRIQLAPEPEKSQFCGFLLLQDQSSRYSEQCRDLGQKDNVLSRYCMVLL